MFYFEFWLAPRDFPSFFVAIMITSFLFLQQHVEMRREMTLISTSYRTKAVEQN